jgi:hypothetical protein
MFVDMPLDNRTVEKLAAIAAVRQSQAVLKHDDGQNDLIFRPGCLFCNIEPKICQYG